MPWQQKEMSILTEVGSNFRLATIPGAQRNGQFGHLGHKTVKRLEITPTIWRRMAPLETNKLLDTLSIHTYYI